MDLFRNRQRLLQVEQEIEQAFIHRGRQIQPMISQQMAELRQSVTLIMTVFPISPIATLPCMLVIKTQISTTFSRPTRHRF
ncbi:hypothetical protein AYI83_15420 [Shewanella algae]|nr:hypothetical protein AYI83_15420 [Shewanella algae]